MSDERTRKPTATLSFSTPLSSKERKKEKEKRRRLKKAEDSGVTSLSLFLILSDYMAKHVIGDLDY